MHRRWARTTTIGLVLLCGAGAWISGELVARHADIWSAGDRGGGLFGRVCRATEALGLDCVGAERTPWARIRVPVPMLTSGPSVTGRPVVVPVAFLGLAYFVFLGTWFACVGAPQESGARRSWCSWAHVPLPVGRVGAVVSAFYLATMALRVAPACVWCSAAHAVNLVLVFLIVRLHRRNDRVGGQPAAPVAVPVSRLAAHAVTFALILIVGLWFHRREQLALGRSVRTLLPYKRLVTTLRADEAFLLREHYAQPRRPIPALRPEVEATAVPRLVVFTDYQCGACYCNAVRLRQQVVPAFAGALVLEVRHYPLGAECNATVGEEARAESCAAAYAAEAARLQGGAEAFQRMHDLLFENRQRLGPELYAELAVHLGLDVQRFQRDLAGEAVRAAVRRDVALARALGVSATPTMFLDGRRINVFARDNPVFWKAIAAADTMSAEQMSVARAGEAEWAVER